MTKVATTSTFSDDEVYDICNALIQQAQHFTALAKNSTHVLETTKDVWRKKADDLLSLSEKVLNGRDITELHVTDY
jgi:hypothetical protein